MAKTTHHDEYGKTFWGDEDHVEATRSRSFASIIFETLSEKFPEEGELKIFELILSLSIDHGPETPSAIKVVEAAKAGKTISEAISVGMLEINDSHGGAGEPLMELMYKIKDENLDIKGVVKQYLAEGKRMPGLGHRIYKGEDPRVGAVFEEMEKQGLDNKFVDLLKNIQEELEKQKGLRLPINIDGAIAVALCSFGWKPRLGKAVFIIARTPGLCAHYLNNS